MRTPGRAVGTAIAASLALLAGIAGGRYLLPVSTSPERAPAGPAPRTPQTPQAVELAPADRFLVVANPYAGHPYSECDGGQEQFHLRVRSGGLASPGYYAYGPWGEYVSLDDLLARLSEAEAPLVILSVDRYVNYEVLFYVTGVLRDAGVKCAVLHDTFNDVLCRSSSDEPWRWCRRTRANRARPPEPESMED